MNSPCDVEDCENFPNQAGGLLPELPENIVACRDPLLSSDRETNTETTSAARQHILNKQILYAAVN
jgi:hypothetical protein